MRFRVADAGQADQADHYDDKEDCFHHPAVSAFCHSARRAISLSPTPITRTRLCTSTTETNFL